MRAACSHRSPTCSPHAYSQGISDLGRRRGNLSVIGTTTSGGPLASPILTFSLPPPWTSHSFAQAMFEHGFIVKQAGHSAAANEGGPTMPMHACRLSFHLFTSEDQVQRLLRTTERLLLG